MGVFARIALRYIAAALVTKGLVSPDTGNLVSADPDIAQAVEIGAGLVTAAASEWWYLLARRMGWSR